MPSNRLIHEKSPYLQQHAQNPVDWYPWGPEALAKAEKEDKPIFLSVGYSTCHWCHVMEHESFENEGIAALLNRYFVPVKVDREERPDLDRIYMTYVQASTGSGGWPMSVWLTPDGKPFVGGTYFPPDNRYGRPGFGAVLKRIAEAWTGERERIAESSERVLEELKAQSTLRGTESALDAQFLDNGFNLWRRTFDARLGGFGQAPKFPRPAVFEFLLRYWRRTGNAEALEMVTTTLKAMLRGGMNDQLGGGFHRYSVDAYWFVPHFEKMLYDQAQIATTLIEAFQITGDRGFADEARRVLDYVQRDMTDPEGGFYSAEDADSAVDSARPNEKSEGAFYIWPASEIDAIVGPERARYFRYRYGVIDEGNVQSDPHGEFSGRNVLFEADTDEGTAHHFEVPLSEVQKALAEARQMLMSARGQRLRPHLDDKILTSWNGLMISAFAKAAGALGEQRYADAARRAADFIRVRLWKPENETLLRRYRQGDAAIPGFLDDYAFFTQALLDLYETQFDWRDLEFAVVLAGRQIPLFADETHGGFFSAPAGDPDAGLLFRVKDDYDGAEPSGNSIAAMNLLRLQRMTGHKDLGDAGRATLSAFAGHMSAQPSGVPLMLCALDYEMSASRELVLVGERDTETTRGMARAIGGRYLPDITRLLANDESKELLAKGNPAIAEMRSVNGTTAAYLCENFTCRQPVTSVGELTELLQ